MSDHRIIRVQPDAPPKPASGAACNGCGVCCAYAPCPLGIVLHWRRRGPCPSLRWDGATRRYYCAPSEGGGLLGRLARRWIASGSGCDCTLEVVSDAAPSSRLAK